MENKNFSPKRTPPIKNKQPAPKKDTSMKDSQRSSETLAAIKDIRQGPFKKRVMSLEEGRAFFHAESTDGESRFILEKTVTADKGVVSESKTAIFRPKDKKSRQQRVCELRKKGMTQTEIALRTMTSQATVSNDIKDLKNQGLLK